MFYDERHTHVCKYISYLQSVVVTNVVVKYLGNHEQTTYVGGVNHLFTYLKNCHNKLARL